MNDDYKIRYFTEYCGIVAEFCNGTIDQVKASTKILSLNTRFPDIPLEMKKTVRNLERARDCIVDEDEDEDWYEDEEQDDEERDDEEDEPEPGCNCSYCTNLRDSK